MNAADIPPINPFNSSASAAALESLRAISLAVFPTTAVKTRKVTGAVQKAVALMVWFTQGQAVTTRALAALSGVSENQTWHALQILIDSGVVQSLPTAPADGHGRRYRIDAKSLSAFKGDVCLLDKARPYSHRERPPGVSYPCQRDEHGRFHHHAETKGKSHARYRANHGEREGLSGGGER